MSPNRARGHLTILKANARRNLRWLTFPGYVSIRAAILVVGLLAAVISRAEQGASSASPEPGSGIATSGSVRGVVAGDDGSVYEGVHVALELTLGDDPVNATQQTDSSGAFNFSNLPAGTFRISIASPGFVTQEVRGTLQAGQAFDVHTIVLPLAGAASYVRVSAQSQTEIAQQQLNFEEQQRVLGFFPNYYVSYDPHPMPLTARQKFQLAWRMSIDPVTWVMTGSVAGMEQASNTFAGYGQGAQGYAKRFSANFADTFNASMLSGAVLPSILHQDPRYFYKGTGSVMSRAMYAIANAVICKGDNGHWQPAYSGILGGLAAGSISNLYYPRSDRSRIEVTFLNSAIGTGESAIQNLFQEFVVRRLTPRLPSFVPKAQ